MSQRKGCARTALGLRLGLCSYCGPVPYVSRICYASLSLRQQGVGVGVGVGVDYCGHFSRRESLFCEENYVK